MWELQCHPLIKKTWCFDVNCNILHFPRSVSGSGEKVWGKWKDNIDSKLHEEVNGTIFTRLQSYLATSTSLYVIWVLNTTWNQKRKLEPTKFTVQFTILNNCAVEHGLKAWLCGKQALHLFSYFSLFLYKLGHCQYKTSHKMKWWILIASFVIIG